MVREKIKVEFSGVHLAFRIRYMDQLSRMKGSAATKLSWRKPASYGRVRTPAHRGETLLDEFEKSGLSGAKFAALSGIKYQTFAKWVQQRRRKGQAGALSSAKDAAKRE